MPLLAGLASIGLLLTACEKPLPACLPPDPPEAAATRPTETSAPGPVHLYLDGSGSMLGFVADNSPSAYREVLNTLPASLGHAASEMEVFRFAAGIEKRSYPGRLAAEILDSSFYRSGTAGGTGVTANSTHLHEVLRRAAANPNVTSAIVSDLFLSADEVHGGESAPLRRALADILHNGMSVALIGVQAPFSGRIFDLATIPGSIQMTKGLRPFYVLLVGPDARVRALYRALRAEVLGAPLIGTHRLAVFSARALPTSGWNQRVTLSQGAVEAALLQKPAASARALQVSVGQRAGGAQVTLDREADDGAWFANQALGPDVQRGAVKSTVQFFTQDRHGCENGWVEDDDRPGLVRMAQGQADRLTFDIFAEPAGGFGFRPQVTYVLDTVVTIPALRAAPEPIRWIEEWSYGTAQEKALVDRVAQRERRLQSIQQPPRVARAAAETRQPDAPEEGPLLFPTLNLAPLADLMVRIVMGKYVPERVHAFRLVFNME